MKVHQGNGSIMYVCMSVRIYVRIYYINMYICMYVYSIRYDLCTMSMSKCSSMVLTVSGLVGFVLDGITLACPTTVRMSGACPPPAPSVWYVCMARPLIAFNVCSTQPDSFKVSVCMVTCTSSASATFKQLSIAAGVVPQSSCSFRPTAPARTISMRPFLSDVFPLPVNAKFIDMLSVDFSIISMWNGPRCVRYKEMVEQDNRSLILRLYGMYVCIAYLGCK